MKISYYVSPRFLSRGLPFWVLPLTLFATLGVVLVWSLIFLHSSPSTRFFDDIKSSLSPSSNELESGYQSALISFNNRFYYTAAKQFQSVVSASGANNTLKRQAYLYYAFSLFFYGESQKDDTLVQNSKESFEYIMRSVPEGSPIYFRAALGDAWATRFLRTGYWQNISSALLTFARQTVSPSLKRSLYLELGYYYFAMNDNQKALFFFERAGSLISDVGLYENAVSREDSQNFLLQILVARLVPEQILYSYGTAIAQKLLNAVVRYIGSGQYNQAFTTLQVVTFSFHTEEILEDVYFFQGFLSQVKGHWKEAISFYQRVLNNGYLSKDPAAYYNMATIFWNVGRQDLALEYFNILSNQYAYTYYGMEAQKILDEHSRLRNGNIPINIDSSPVMTAEDAHSHFSSRPVILPATSNRVVSRVVNRITPSFTPSSVGNIAPTPPEPQKPVVNVNINQSRSFVTTRDSNNTDTTTRNSDNTDTRTTMSRNEKDAHNSSYSSSRRGSGNTLTSLSKNQNQTSRSTTQKSQDSSTHDSSIHHNNAEMNEPSLEKDFDETFPPVGDVEIPPAQDEDNVFSFESPKNPPKDYGDLAEDFDNLNSGSAH